MVQFNERSSQKKNVLIKNINNNLFYEKIQFNDFISKMIYSVKIFNENNQDNYKLENSIFKEV